MFSGERIMKLETYALHKSDKSTISQRKIRSSVQTKRKTQEPKERARE